MARRPLLGMIGAAYSEGVWRIKGFNAMPQFMGTDSTLIGSELELHHATQKVLGSTLAAQTWPNFFAGRRG
jgi:hypothetical protein